MGEIQLSIEGEDAAEAAEAFFELPEISGTWESLADEQKDPTLEIVAAVATFASITGLTAQQIREWYLKWRGGKKSGKRVEKVVIICRDGKRRLLMKDASVEDVQLFLEKC